MSSNPTRSTKWTTDQSLAITRAIVVEQETTGQRVTYSHIVRASVADWVKARGVVWPENEKEVTP
jgi:hypothetical protein